MRSIKDMLISQKLKYTFAAFGALFVAGMVLVMVFVTFLSRDYNEFYSQEFTVVRARGEFAFNNQGAAKTITRMMVASELTDKVAAASTVDEQSKLLVRHFAKMESCLDEMDNSGVLDKATINELKMILPGYKAITEQITSACRSGDHAEALRLHRSFMATSDQLGEHMTKISELTDQQAKVRTDATRTMQYITDVVMIIAAIIVFIVLRLLYSSLTSSIVKPIKELESVAKRMTVGKLDNQVEYHSNDELGLLAETFRHMSYQLALYIKEITDFTEAIAQRKLSHQCKITFNGDFEAVKDSLEAISRSLSSSILQIGTSADQVMKGAEQIAIGGQSLSQASVEQASSVTELAATINDVSQRVQENAESAMEASRHSDMVRKNIIDSTTYMKQMNESLQRAKVVSIQTAGIIKDMENLAFQTNLLALNAAVEAARAGEAGRGFAVVAKEVRSLSSKATEASKHTNDLLNEAVKRIGESADMSNSAVVMLDKVASDVQDVAGRVDHISSVSNEQATAIAQIRESIDMISQVIQENSATAEESAASSEELTGQMQMLKRLVEAYELSEQEHK